MKEKPTRRVEAPEREQEQHPQAATGLDARSSDIDTAEKPKVVVINGGLHSRLKARAAREGRKLQALVEDKLMELEPETAR